MRAHEFTFKDPFWVTAEFRFSQLESFIQIALQACKAAARQEKRILEETLSDIIKETRVVEPKDIFAVPHFHRIAEHVSAYHDTIPRCLSYSFVIQVYNLFEELAKNLHTELMQRENIPDPKKLASRNFLGHFEKFATTAGITFGEWSALHDFKEIRNNIVHRGGVVSGDDKEVHLRRIIKTHSKTLRIDDGLIQVQPEFAVEGLNVVSRFFSQAFRQKNFQDGYWWTPSPQTSYGVRFDGQKVSIMVDSELERTGDK
jgi:hypothetical protein